MRIKSLLPFLFAFLFTLTTFAQSKHTQLGEEAFKERLWFAAIDNYKTALKKEKDKALKMHIMYNMAQCYDNIKDNKNAISWYKKVVKKGKTFLDDHPEVYLKLANALKKSEKYEDAMDQYKAFQEKAPGDKRGIRGQKSCELAIKWTEKPTRYKVENMRQINSKNNDAIPVYANKRYKELIFQSYRSGATGKGENERNGEAYPDLYLTKVDKKGKWSKPAVVGGDPKLGVNTEAAEGGPTMNKRKNTIYFTRCEAVEAKGKKNVAKEKDEDRARCRIYFAKKKGQKFGEAIQLNFGNGFDTVIVAHPALSPDDKVMYFVSNMEGGLGGYDIWYAVYDKKAKTFKDPKNLGPEVNTPNDEMYPFVHQDGTLYFSSNGHVGIGGFDLFKVEKTEDGWGPVQNLKVPLNSSADDISIMFEGKNERGFLTSNRSGTKGKMDIWSFTLPKLELMVQGTVYDQVTRQPIPSSKVTMNGSDGSMVEAIADDKGFYQFKLAPNTSYQLMGSSDEKVTNKFGTERLKYFNSERALINTIGVEESKTFVQDLELKPIPDEGIELPNILYAFNKATLLDESKLKLNTLVETMESNPTLVIELGSHTDFRGSATYNRKLAQKRAQAAVDYLVSKGVARDRMLAKGYGEDEPKSVDSSYVSKYTDYSGKTKKGKKVTASAAHQQENIPAGSKLNEAFINGLKDDGLKEAAHQMNRRTEFKVLRTDYKPGQTAEGGGSGEGKKK